MTKPDKKKDPDWIVLIRYTSSYVLGPSISALLEKFVISDPSEWLVAVIYFLGFSLSAISLWLSVKHRKLEFLETMVYRKQTNEKGEMEGGIVDANSVKMAEAVSKI